MNPKQSKDYYKIIDKLKYKIENKNTFIIILNKYEDVYALSIKYLIFFCYW